jgi:hypothetical protein
MRLFCYYNDLIIHTQKRFYDTQPITQETYSAHAHSIYNVFDLKWAYGDPGTMGSWHSKTALWN